MSDSALPIEYARAVIVLLALSVNVRAWLEARQDGRFAAETRVAALMFMARRNLRREHLRCLKQVIILGVSALTLIVRSATPPPAVLIATLSLIALSLIISGESYLEMRDRRVLQRDAAASEVK